MGEGVGVKIAAATAQVRAILVHSGPSVLDEIQLFCLQLEASCFWLNFFAYNFREHTKGVMQPHAA